MVRTFWILGLLILVLTEFLRIYFIMPFPGSQKWDTVQLAYVLNQHAWFFRIFGLMFVLIPGIQLIREKKLKSAATVITAVPVWLIVFYVVSNKLQADKMFYQPTRVTMLPVSENIMPRNSVVIGLSLNGLQRAYPIELIGYHHQVRDTVGGQPVMVTYCTVCRTGRIFSPVVNGKTETFRLVGMDHFNAMFEDSGTKSWWQQVNGTAIAGPLKGMRLKELPYEQMTLDAWIAHYPNTLILQPDSAFAKQYSELSGYSTGEKKGKLTGTDSLSWKDKSWILGITLEHYSRAYDWRYLSQVRLIHDQLGKTSLVLVQGPDKFSFHAWVRPDTLIFYLDNNVLTDKVTGSFWNWNGECIEGPLKGIKLNKLQAYQEYWHSWKTFHPQTTRYPE